VIAVFAVFVMPLVYLLGLEHQISSGIATVAFGVGGIAVLVTVFGEKFFSLPQLLSKSTSAPKVYDSSTQQTSVSGHSSAVQIFSQDVVRTMKPDEQFEYYTKIIQRYTALRLQLSSADGSSASQLDTRSKQEECDVELASPGRPPTDLKLIVDS
jgi:hypothetical protein